jgi:hypothetical protein
VEGCAAVTVLQGAPSVTVTADDNVQDRVEVRVDDGVLRVEADGFTTSQVPSVVVTLPAASLIEVNDAAALIVDGVAVDELSIDASDAGSIVVRGSVGSLQVVAEDAASVDASGLSVSALIVSSSGSSSVTVQASVSASITSSDASSVSVSGSASVQTSAEDVATITVNGVVVTTGLDDDSVPDVSIPDVSIPDISIPDVSIPDVDGIADDAIEEAERQVEEAQRQAEDAQREAEDAIAEAERRVDEICGQFGLDC